MTKNNKKKKHQKRETNTVCYDAHKQWNQTKASQQSSTTQKDSYLQKYHQMTIAQLYNVLKDFNFTIKEALVLKKYQDFHDMYSLYSHFIKDDSPLPQTDISQHHAILFIYLEKIISTYFTLHTLPDAYYIQKDTRLLEQIQSNHTLQIESAISIIDRLINYSFVTGQKSFQHFQITYQLSMANILIHTFDMVTSIKPSHSTIYSTITIIKTLCASFPLEIDFIEDMEALILKWYSYAHDIEKLESHRQEMLLKYPKEPYFIHYALLSGLIHTKDRAAMEQYYVLARKYMLFSNKERQIAKALENLSPYTKQKQFTN